MARPLVDEHFFCGFPYAKVEKHSLAKLLLGFRQQVTWQTIHGVNLNHAYLKSDMGIEVKNHQPYYSDHCENLMRISYYMRKKDLHKISSRSLTRAVLLWFYWSSSIKCNSNLSFLLINPYFNTFN